MAIKTINQDAPEISDVEWSVGGAGDRVKERRQSEGEKTKRQGHYLVRILAWDAGDGELGCTHFL